MATRDYPMPQQKSTSITANVTLMASVTMSFAEMEQVAEMVEAYNAGGTRFEHVRDEFLAAVNSLR